MEKNSAEKEETIEMYDHGDDQQQQQQMGNFLLLNKKHKMNMNLIQFSSSTSISDLPYQLLNEILSRLPSKTVLSCKSVCKPWLFFLSSPDFLKTHFEKSSICALILSYGNRGSSIPKTLHLIEAQTVSDITDDGEFIFNGDVKVNLVSKFDHPMKDAEIKLIPNYTLPCSWLTLVNSCRGLVCMVTSDCPTLLVVCNPIDGDYITVSTTHLTYAFLIGLGFGPSTNQYKLLRMAQRQVIEPVHEECWFSWGTELYTIGSGRMWRRVENVPDLQVFCHVRPSFITSVNGFLFWLYDDYEFIDSFDFDNEKFRRVLPPHGFHGVRGFVSLGVLGGSLCLSNASSLKKCEIWILKNNGTIQECWIRAYVVKISTEDNGWGGFYKPIRYLNNGKVLMFYSRNALVVYDPVKQTARYLKIPGVQRKCEAIPHIPCLVSWKDVMGDNAKLLNIKSRGHTTTAVSNRENAALRIRRQAGLHFHL
ncbi:unnamed protein product [Camellia sinensis]